MSEKYLLVLAGGKRFDGISLDEVKRILIDDCHYSYARVKEMTDSVVGRDYSLPTIEWQRGQKQWIVNGVKMGRKPALFALQWKGHTPDEAQCLLRAAKLLAETKETLQELADNAHDEMLLSYFADGFRQALLERKS